MTIQNNWPTTTHPDLLIIKTSVFDVCNFNCSVPQPESESSEYGAYTFDINSKSIIFRVAKITPTKNGQFVTIWKRNDSGVIAPFDFSDPIDFVIITVRFENRLGFFMFPKIILVQKGVFSTAVKEGKRAIRVYPAWDKTTSKQAEKTQLWQSDYFFEINSGIKPEEIKEIVFKGI